MKILVACEESGRVRDAFSKLGHDAWSCDIQPSRTPGKHYLGDVRNILNDGWDMMIAHPPCTYLTVSNTHMKRGCKKYTADEAIILRQEAVKFFMALVDAPIEKIAIENPIGIMSTVYKKPSQIIRPFQYGENSTKATCLWLKNLPLLTPTNIITPETHTSKSGKVYDKWWFQTSLIRNLEERSKVRSETFPGIANAMAQQWGNFEA